MLGNPGTVCLDWLQGGFGCFDLYAYKLQQCTLTSHLFTRRKSRLFFLTLYLSLTKYGLFILLSLCHFVHFNQTLAASQVYYTQEVLQDTTFNTFFDNRECFHSWTVHVILLYC